MTPEDIDWADARVAEGKSLGWSPGSRKTGVWFLDADGVRRWRRLPSLGPTAHKCGLEGWLWNRRFRRMTPEQRRAEYRKRHRKEWKP